MEKTGKNYQPLTRIIQGLLYLPPDPIHGPDDGLPIPLSYEDRPHDHAIINCGWKNLLLKTARQVEKSFKILGICIARMAVIPGFRAMYIAPTDTDLHTFSDEKLETVFHASYPLNRMLLDGPSAKKKFSEWRFNNGSTFRLRNAARGGANLRGPTVDQSCYDEYQLIPPGVVAVGHQMMHHSPHKYEFKTGTPLTYDNQIETEWGMSSQTEWYVKCEACSGGDTNYYNIIGLRNFTPKGLICDRCGRFINPVKGMWVDHVKGANIQGFRIPQGIGVWSDYEDIYWNTIKKESEAVIANEVLGLSFDSASQFLSMEHLKAVSDPRYHLVEDLPYAMKSRRTFMGIDWAQNTKAGHFNCAVIGLDIDGIRWRPVWARIFPKFIDADDQFNEMMEAIDRFKVNLVCADHGASGDRNVRISRVLGPDGVVQVNYVYSMDYYGKFMEGTRVLRVGRTPCLTSFRTDLVHRNNIVLPNLDDLSDFIPHLLAEKVETDRFGHLNYILPAGRDDDGLMAFTYANMAHRIMRGMPAVDDVFMPAREDIERRSKRADAW